MPDSLVRSPVFETVLSGDADAERRTVVLKFRAEDQKTHQIELSVFCAQTSLAALLAGYGKLLRKLPDEGFEIQSIPVTGSQTAMTGDGTPVLKFVLAGGAEFQLEIPRNALARLCNQLQELQKAVDPKQRH